MVHYHDSGCAVATCGNLFICVFRDPSTLERLTHIRRAIERHAAHFGADTISISVLEPSAASSVPKEVRDETAALTRDFQSIAAAIVIEGAGFRAATLRTILAGIYLLAKSPYPHKILDSVQNATRWLREQAEHSPNRLTITEMVNAVEQARHAISAKVA